MVKSRLRDAWKAFSVQAIAVLATQEVWYPVVAATAEAAFGDHARVILTAGIAVAGVLGWTRPQRSIKTELVSVPPKM